MSARHRLSLFAMVALIFAAIPTKGKAEGSGINVYGDGKYGYAGCGLGSLIFGPKPGPVQIVAATFNATSGNQTFGITTGTSNCGKGIFQAEQMDFIQNNLAAMERDAAQGRGDALIAYGTTLGCPVGSLPEFQSQMQVHFGEVFATREAEGVWVRTRQLVAGSSLLKESCRKI